MASFVMVVCCYIISGWLEHFGVLSEILGITVLGVVVYIGIMSLIDRPLVQSFWRAFRNGIGLKIVARETSSKF